MKKLISGDLSKNVRKMDSMQSINDKLVAGQSQSIDISRNELPLFSAYQNIEEQKQREGQIDHSHLN